MSDTDPDVAVDDQAQRFVILCAVKKSDGKPYPLRQTASGELVVDAEFTGDVIVDIDLPESTYGKTLSLTGGVADQLPARALKAGLVLAADEDNLNDVWVGGSGVTVGDGFRLSPGESVPIATENQNTVYVIGTAAEKVNILSG